MKSKNKQGDSTAAKSGQNESKTASVASKHSTTMAVTKPQEQIEERPKFNVEDHDNFQKNEETIENNLGGFLAMGEALNLINQRELHRIVHPDWSFETYCENRWGFGKAYAYRLIGAFKCVDNLRTALGSQDVKMYPTNEAQVRPLARLEPAEQIKVWKQVLRKAKDGLITAALVEEVVGKEFPSQEAAPENEEPSAQTAEKADHKKLEAIKKLLKRAKSIKPADLTVGRLMDILNEIAAQLENDNS